MVKRVPPGRVTTYGDVGAALGLRTIARQVGYALAALGDRDDVPWYRVVNSRGEMSPRSFGDGADQRSLLEADGVEVDPCGRIVDFAERRYSPRPIGHGYPD